MDIKKTLEERIFETGELGRLAHLPIHLREKEFNQKMIDLAQEFNIPDFKIFYGNNRCQVYSIPVMEDEKNIIHYDIQDENGETVKAQMDFSDSKHLAKYRLSVEKLSRLYGYNRIRLIYDGGREMNYHYLPGSANDKIIKF